MSTTPSPVLSERSLEDLKELELQFPCYNRSSVQAGILHLGAGNFHRAHQCVYVDRLLELGKGSEFGIIGAGLLDIDKSVADALQAQDTLFTVTEMSSGESSSAVIGSMIGYLRGFSNPQVVIDAIADPRIKIVSLTVTESGYFVEPSTGRLMTGHPDIAHDLATCGRERPRTVFGYLVAGLKERFARSAGPVTLLSCDNLQGNGDVLRETLREFASLAAPELLKEINSQVSFPNCMVDRITPRTSDEQRALIEERYGVRDQAPVVCEPYIQWVIEDHFAAGRPPLEEVGVQFTKDVKPYELMKLRLLNAGHSSMGYLGYLMGYRFIHEVARDPECAAFTRGFMDLEATPTLTPLPDVDFKLYKDSLQVRFANSSIKDQALRICSDGSGKIRSFILPIVRDCISKGIPYPRTALIIASWMRFVSGVDEQGDAIPLEDPLASTLKSLARGSSTDADALLDLKEVFGDLSGNTAFRKEVSGALAILYSLGARGAVQALQAKAR